MNETLTDDCGDLTELRLLEKMKEIALAGAGFIDEDRTVLLALFAELEAHRLLALFAELEAHREQKREDRERKPGVRLDEEIAKIKSRLKRLEEDR